MLLTINIEISDWIQIAIASITLLGVLTSIIISVKTLKQNSKMIESSTRAQIIFFKDVYNFTTPAEYIIMKNIGHSLAHIISISYDRTILDTIKYSNSNPCEAIDKFNNGYIAPGQSYKIPISTKNSDSQYISIDIKYSDELRKYNETYNISLKQDSSVCILQHHQPGNELKVVSNSIQEFIKRTS